MKYKLLITGLIILVAVGAFWYALKINHDSPAVQSQTEFKNTQIGIVEPYTKKIKVKNNLLFVEIMDTEEKREQGLSNRAKLTDTQGMLFDLRTSNVARPQFWMKDMLFNLDLIWIKNGLVVDITKNALAPEVNTKLNELPLYKPNSDIDMVLEVNSGWTDKNNIRIGDHLTY